jgi:dipeptidase E
MPDAADLLLLSNSAMFGHRYLEHALPAIADFLGESRRVHFVAYALADLDAYTARVQEALSPLDVSVIGIHQAQDPHRAIEEAGLLFVGGGNTFRLLAKLQELDVLELVHRRVVAGALRYLGASAGTNVACPTIRTTNDMPIVEPASLTAFGLIPFQINPHYQDPLPDSTHMGETREQRLLEFLQDNDVPVLGIREGAWLRRRASALQLEGQSGARLFRRGRPPEEIAPGANLTWLLETSAQFDVRAESATRAP